MTVVEIGGPSEERLQTTVCGLCGANYERDYKQFSSHHANEDTFDDLQLKRRPSEPAQKPEVRCDGGEEIGQSADDTDQYSSDRKAADDNDFSGTEFGRRLEILTQGDEPRDKTARGVLSYLLTSGIRRLSIYHGCPENCATGGTSECLAWRVWNEISVPLQFLDEISAVRTVSHNNQLIYPSNHTSSPSHVSQVRWSKTPGIEHPDTVDNQDGRFCSRKFWAYPSSSIININARPYIHREIAELSALACWATWRKILIQPLFHQRKYLFRNRLILQSTPKSGLISKVQNGRKRGQVGGCTDGLSTISGLSASDHRSIGSFIPGPHRFAGGDD